MDREKPIIALIYDFDKTLTPDDLQNYSFIPALGMTSDEFWKQTGEFSDKTGVERILSYMYVMILKAKEKGIKLTKEYLFSLGKDLRYFDGVLTWFERVNAYGERKGVKIEHYLISSGTKEIIEGSAIAHEFKAIFGCEFYFDPETQVPVWPKLAINYTAKTQFYFRITKGVLNTSEDNAVNRKSVHRIPHRNVVYIGDGMTDVPVMLLVKQNGGHSIAVYPKGNREKVEYLYNEGRVNFVSRADYTEKSEIFAIVKLIIDQVNIAEQIERKDCYQMNNFELNNIVEGTISEIKPYGAIVTFAEKRTGLLHLKEISDFYISNINNYLQLGSSIKLKIIGIDEINGFLRLSLKSVPQNERTTFAKEKSYAAINPVQEDFTPLQKALPQWIEKTLEEIKHETE